MRRQISPGIIILAPFDFAELLHVRLKELKVSGLKKNTTIKAPFCFPLYFKAVSKAVLMHACLICVRSLTLFSCNICNNPYQHFKEGDSVQIQQEL